METIEPPFRAPVTNEQVSKDLGISNSMVSRLRNGDRHPSVALMRRITEVYRWRGESQMGVFGGPAYARKFEEALSRHYSSQERTVTT